MLSPERLIESKVVTCPDWLTAKAAAVVGDLDSERIKFWARPGIIYPNTDRSLRTLGTQALEERDRIILLRSLAIVSGESGWPRIAALVEAECSGLDDSGLAGVNPEILTGLYFTYLAGRWKGVTAILPALKKEIQLPNGLFVFNFIEKISRKLTEKASDAGWGDDETWLGLAFSRLDYWETAYPSIRSYFQISLSKKAVGYKQPGVWQKAIEVDGLLKRTPVTGQPFLLALWESQFRFDHVSSLLNTSSIAKQPEKALVWFLRGLSGETVRNMAPRSDFTANQIAYWKRLVLASFDPQKMERRLNLVRCQEKGIKSPQISISITGETLFGNVETTNLVLSVIEQDEGQFLRAETAKASALFPLSAGLNPKSVSALERLLVGEKLVVNPQDLRWSLTPLGELLKWLELNDLRPLFKQDGNRLFLSTEIRYGSIDRLMQRFTSRKNDH